MDEHAFATEPGRAAPVPSLGDSVIDQIRDHAIFMLDAAGRIASWNAGCREVFGYDEDEWIGQPARFVFLQPDIDAGVPERELVEASDRGRASDDRWLRRRNGEPLFGVGTVSRIDGDDGRLVGFTKVIRDYTAMRQADDERKRLLGDESTARARAAREAAALTAAIDAIPDGVFIGDARGIERCNAAALALLGATGIDDLRQPLSQFQQRFRMRKERDGTPLTSGEMPFRRALAGEVSVLEFWATRLTGDDVCIRATAAPIVVDGAIVGAVSVDADITEHVHLQHRQHELSRVETILRARDQELRALVEGVREYAIFTVNLDGRISSWHEGAERMKGYTAKEAVGMLFANLFTEDDRARGQPDREMRIAAETGEYQGEGHRLRKNGEIFEAAVVLTALRGPDGEVLGFLKLTQDITARRKQEHDQREALRNAEAARAEAERVSRSMGEFLATISHELRTPLSAILGWAAVLSRSATGPQAGNKRGLDAITRNARAQIGLIEDLLDMNRIETGQLRLDVQPVDIGSVVAGAMDAVQPAARAKGLGLATRLDPIDGTVSGDPARLQQIAWNLLMNAVKFTSSGGTITIGLRQTGDRVELSVADTGQGIDPDFVPHLFDRFRQQDATTTRRHGGLGLGLSIVKQLTELHGGTVQAESPGPGRGATFTVRLPISDRPVEASETPAASRPDVVSTARLAEAPRLDGARVLLVDDEADVRDVAALVLQDAGADVAAAASAREALSLFHTHRPDVLVSDIGMPQHDGYQLLRWIRATEPDEEIRTPALAFTAYATAEDHRRVLKAGFEGHVVKPFEPEVLIEAIASVWERRRAQREDRST